jgi:hypothetical protein
MISYPSFLSPPLHFLSFLVKPIKIINMLMLKGFLLTASAVAIASAGKPGTPLGGIPTTTIAPNVDMPLQGIGTWLYNSSRAEEAVFTALTLKPTPYVHIDTALI